MACCFTIKLQDIQQRAIGKQRREKLIQKVIADSIRSISVEAKRAYRVEEVASILSIGRSLAYNLVRQGCFKTVRIGTSIRISKKSFDEWLDRQNL